jgi:hypothetical protein
VYIENALDGFRALRDEPERSLKLLRGNVVEANVGAPRHEDRGDPSPERPCAIDRDGTLSDIGREGERHLFLLSLRPRRFEPKPHGFESPRGKTMG